ncbi:MAG: VOC family protein [Sphaerochaetaceae bacterium]|nr:VOC family protein [Sphaerochaetaceae bacterium]
MKPLPFLQDGVAQIAFVVEDLDKTVENYYRLFNIAPWHFYTYEKPLVSHMTRNGAPTDYAMRVALSYFGKMRIELIEQKKGDTVYKEFIENHGYGIHHLGVLVDDMEEAIALANEAGFNVTMDGAGFGLDGDGHYAYLDTEDSIGTTIELICRPKGRRVPEKIYPEEAGK